jgi:DnaJ-class molecular chaperone
MAMNKSPYDVLQVSPNASLEVIRAAYKALCMRFHPDVAGNNANALERMTQINVAYEEITKGKARTANSPREQSSAQRHADDNAREKRAWEEYVERETSSLKEEKLSDSDKKIFENEFRQMLERRRVQAQLTRIAREFNPDIKGVDDILAMDTADDFKRLVSSGSDFYEAYRLANAEAIAKKNMTEEGGNSNGNTAS